MLADAGATVVILGHSERRSAFGETDADVAAKVEAAIAAGLEPIVCVGETLQQREAGDAIAVVSGQVAGSLPSSLAERDFAVAYEPVWAIGTGLTPLWIRSPRSMPPCAPPSSQSWETALAPRPFCMAVRSNRTMRATFWLRRKSVAPWSVAHP